MLRGQNTNTYGAEIRTDTVFYPSVHESLQIQGVPSCTAKSLVAGTPFVWKNVFGRFLPSLSRIRRSHVTLMRKFGPTALNFFLFVNFLGHSVLIHIEKKYSENMVFVPRGKNTNTYRA